MCWLWHRISLLARWLLELRLAIHWPRLRLSLRSRLRLRSLQTLKVVKSSTHMICLAYQGTRSLSAAPAREEQALDCINLHCSRFNRCFDHIQGPVESAQSYLLRLLQVVLLHRRPLVGHWAWVVLHRLWLHLALMGWVLHGRVLMLARRWLLLPRWWLVLHGRVRLLGRPVLVGACVALQEKLEACFPSAKAVNPYLKAILFSNLFENPARMCICTAVLVRHSRRICRNCSLKEGQGQSLGVSGVCNQFLEACFTWTGCGCMWGGAEIWGLVS